MRKQQPLSAMLEYLESNGGRLIANNAEPLLNIRGGKNVEEATEQDLTFISMKLKEKSVSVLKSTKSRLILIDQELVEDLQAIRNDVTILSVNDPKKLMVSCLKHFFTNQKIVSIHPTALIHEQVKPGQDFSIGAYSIVEANVSIGNNCVIESHVHIKENTVIGNSVYIKSGVVIGGKGFGFVKGEDNVWIDFPHFGAVIIEDNVEIGSNTCIDRGALGDTRIGKGTKIDNLVHIAHNVKINDNCLIIADAMLGGSVTIGENTWVAPSASIRNGLTIGANSLIGMGAVVTKNVMENSTVAGNPAKPFDKK